MDFQLTPEIAWVLLSAGWLPALRFFWDLRQRIDSLAVRLEHPERHGLGTEGLQAELREQREAVAENTHATQTLTELLRLHLSFQIKSKESHGETI